MRPLVIVGKLEESGSFKFTLSVVGGLKVETGPGGGRRGRRTPGELGRHKVTCGAKIQPDLPDAGGGSVNL